MTEKGIIFVMVGCSGAGKTWRGKVLMNQHQETTRRSCTYISKDEIREDMGRMLGVPLNRFIEDPALRAISNRLFRMQVHAATKQGKDVIIDAIHNTVEARMFTLKGIAKKNDYEIIAVVTEATDVELLKKNVKVRHAYLKTVGLNSAEYPTPDDVIEKQHREYVRPSQEEGFSEIWLHQAEKYAPITIQAKRTNKPAEILTSGSFFRFLSKIFTKQQKSEEIAIPEQETSVDAMPKMSGIKLAELRAYLKVNGQPITFKDTPLKGGVRRRLLEEITTEDLTIPQQIIQQHYANRDFDVLRRFFLSALKLYIGKEGYNELEVLEDDTIPMSPNNIKVVLKHLQNKDREESPPTPDKAKPLLLGYNQNQEGIQENARQQQQQKIQANQEQQQMQKLPDFHAGPECQKFETEVDQYYPAGIPIPSNLPEDIKEIMQHQRQDQQACFSYPALRTQSIEWVKKVGRSISLDDLPAPNNQLKELLSEKVIRGKNAR